MLYSVPCMVQYGKYQKCGPMDKIQAESSRGGLPVTFVGETAEHQAHFCLRLPGSHVVNEPT